MSGLTEGEHADRPVWHIPPSQLRPSRSSVSESAELFRGIFEAAAVGITLMDKRGRALDVNPALQRMLGYSKAEIRRIGFHNITHPDDVALDVALYEDLVAGRRDSYQVEKRYIHRDGHVVWTLLTVSSMREPDGLLRSTIAIIEDITEQKLMQQTIARRLACERMLAQLSMCAVMADDVWNFQDECLHILAQVLDVSRIYIFTYDRDTDTFTNSFEWVARGVEPQKDNLQNLPASHFPWFTEMMLRNRIVNCSDIRTLEHEPEKTILESQDIKSVLIVPLFVGEDLYGFIGFDECRSTREWQDEDVTILQTAAQIISGVVQRKQGELALRKSEATSRALLGAIPDLVLRIDDNGIVLDANRDTRHAGFTRRQMIGASVRSLLPEGLGDDAMELIRRSLAHDEPQSCQFVLSTPDEWRCLEVRCIRSGVSEVLAVVRDITEWKQAERALEEAYHREHRIASALQGAVIPVVDLDIPNYGIAASFRPAYPAEAAVGGDFYDVFRTCDGRIGIVMGDISGKGLEAAIHNAMARHMLRAYACEDPEPASVLERLNRAICECTDSEMFVTVFYGVLDPATRIITYANAGHDKPLLHRQKDGVSIPLDTTGKAMGIVRDASYEQRTLQLSPGDVLLMYTDGVTDARTGDRVLGIEGLSDILSANASQEEHFIADAVLAAASNASGGKLSDDAAVIIIKARSDQHSPEPVT